MKYEIFWLHESEIKKRHSTLRGEGKAGMTLPYEKRTRLEGRDRWIEGRDEKMAG